MTREIPLTRGKTAIIDEDDYESVSRYKWFYYHGGYAVRSSYVSGKRGTVFMHREINNTPDGMETDHINGDKLDNRKENLRTCTSSQNKANIKSIATNTSGFKGVSKYKLTNKWVAKIEVNKHCMNLGYFDTPEEAARAYDR